MTFEQPKAVAQNLCIGCGYCASFDDVAMRKNSAGFNEPVRASGAYEAREAALIEQACPGYNGMQVSTPSEKKTLLHRDFLWGPYYDCMTGFSTDPAIRRNGSSGGVISGLAEWLVSSGEVDGVIATYYDPEFPIGTVSTLVADPAEAALSAGSKYAPAAPLAALSHLRRAEGRYAVIGKPCDIATLRRAISAGDPIGEKVAILLSFYCAGTPSDRGNRAVLDHLGAPPPEGLDSFRHRGDGWPGRTRAVAKDGSEKSCTYGESWGTILRSHTHNLCIICPDGIGEQADLVAADAWYGDEKGYPVFEEAEGRSLIMTRTELGRDLLTKARAAGVLECKQLEVRQIDTMQPGQWKRRRELSLRVAAYRLLGRATPRYNRQALKAYQRGMTAKEKVKVFYGTLRRVARTMIR